MYADGDVTLNGVSASGNLGYGADVSSYGTVDITNSQFNSNGFTYRYSRSCFITGEGNFRENEEDAWGDGLDARGDAGVTLNGVSAVGNLGYGADV